METIKQNTLRDTPGKPVQRVLTSSEESGGVSSSGLFYCIDNYSRMSPFLMNITSSDDLWMFISSTGGLTAGRRDADAALFPYYTEDKITENSQHTGSRTILRLNIDDAVIVWEPFRPFQPVPENIRRSLQKSAVGNSIIFREHHLDIDLIFSYAWTASPRWGWIRSASLENCGSAEREISIIDGASNILPYGIDSQIQNRLSNLLDAYKLAEYAGFGLALYGMSTRLTDRAEASECLKVTTVWQYGLDTAVCLLSDTQLNNVVSGSPVIPESRNEGGRGAYFSVDAIRLQGGESRRWIQVMEVEQDYPAVADLLFNLQTDPENIARNAEFDAAAGGNELVKLVSRADGLQAGGDLDAASHHYANTLFNCMRGGIFVEGYAVSAASFLRYIGERNFILAKQLTRLLSDLPPLLGWHEFENALLTKGSSLLPDSKRLLYGYLPLVFSRRHGDPSRPWNTFSISVRNDDGSYRFAYQGNWRDIFQNWEPLAYSFPGFIRNMITIFANGITADGYNPYRVTSEGYDWERPEPEDPWTNIGYWGDHQVIYLLKLLEAADALQPELLLQILDERLFTTPDIPYRIKPYREILSNPYDTIIFDHKREETVSRRCRKEGRDGQCARSQDGELSLMTLMDKLLLILLIKRQQRPDRLGPVSGYSRISVSRHNLFQQTSGCCRYAGIHPERRYPFSVQPDSGGSRGVFTLCR